MGILVGALSILIVYLLIRDRENFKWLIKSQEMYFNKYDELNKKFMEEIRNLYVTPSPEGAGMGALDYLEAKAERANFERLAKEQGLDANDIELSVKEN